VVEYLLLITSVVLRVSSNLNLLAGNEFKGIASVIPSFATTLRLAFYILQTDTK